MRPPHDCLFIFRAELIFPSFDDIAHIGMRVDESLERLQSSSPFEFSLFPSVGPVRSMKGSTITRSLIIEFSEIQNLSRLAACSWAGGTT